LPLLVFSYVTNLSGPRFTFNFQFVDWIRFSLRDLQFITLQRIWGDLVHRGIWQFRTVSVVLPVLFLFFAGSFGLNALALPKMVKDFFSLRRTPLLRMVLILFFLGCVLFYFGINVKLEGRDRNVTNIYVYFMGLIVLCLFWSEVFMRFLERRKKAIRPALLILVILFSTINSARFLWIKYQTPDPRKYTSALLETLDWINTHTEIESVLIHPLGMQNTCYFMDRRVVLDISGHSFLTWHLTSDQIRERAEDVKRFFADPRFNADVLDKYQVAYVLGSEKNPFWEDAPPEMFSAYINMGTKQMRKVKKSHVLARVFYNQEYVVYRIQSLPEEEREIFLLEEQGEETVFKKFQSLK